MTVSSPFNVRQNESFDYHNWLVQVSATTSMKMSHDVIWPMKGEENVIPKSIYLVWNQLFSGYDIFYAIENRLSIGYFIFYSELFRSVRFDRPRLIIFYYLSFLRKRGLIFAPKKRLRNRKMQGRSLIDAA